MSMRIPVAVIVLLVVTCAVAFAQGLPPAWEQAQPEVAPVASWYGSTGLIVTPTASTLPAGHVQGGYHRMNFDVRNQTVVNVNVGITDDIELGGARVSNVPAPPPDCGYLNEYILNAKYKLDLARWLHLDTDSQLPDVAIGAWDATNETNRSLYVVLSKELPVDSGTTHLAVHLGYGDSDRPGGLLDGLFAGLEVVPVERALIQVEYDADHINACARYFVLNELALEVGVVDSSFAWGATLVTPF